MCAAGVLHLALMWLEKQLPKKGFVHGCLNIVVNMLMGGKKYCNIVIEKGGLRLLAPFVACEDVELQKCAVIGVAHLARYGMRFVGENILSTRFCFRGHSSNAI